jgi:CRISPR-associated protein Csm4
VKYYLYRLNFLTALHIGNDSGLDNLASAEITIHSDTVYSALCTEAVLYGQDTLNRWVDLAKNVQILFSDALPFRENEYFLPKPAFRKQSVHPLSNPKDRKLMKKLSFIPLSMFHEYLSASDSTPFDIRRALSLQKDLVFPVKRQCVAISGQEATLPYFVGSVYFNDNCGLYLIVGAETEDAKKLFEKLLSSLSYNGIGGKRSAGLGKFRYDEPIAMETSKDPSICTLLELLLNRNADYYITLNTSLPKEEEMEEALTDGHFVLCRRGGFIQSTKYAAEFQKKKTVYALAPGTCVERTYSGEFLDLAQGGAHPVYRYLKPMFAGVNV